MSPEGDSSPSNGAHITDTDVEGAAKHSAEEIEQEAVTNEEPHSHGTPALEGNEEVATEQKKLELDKPEVIVGGEKDGSNGTGNGKVEEEPPVDESAESVSGRDSQEDDIVGELNNDSLHVNSVTSSQTHSRKVSTTSILSSSGVVDNTKIFQKTFEYIVSSKDAKKNETMKNAVQRALDSLNDPDSRDAQLLFEALKISCESGNSDIKAKSVDLFAKLFDYASFDDEVEKVNLTDASVDVIASCFEGEGTDSEVELQVVRALMHSILLMPCHGASLLKAVRQIYNVFIFSLSSRNQAVAQGILTQAIGAIFQRVNTEMISKTRGKRSNSTMNVKQSRISSKEDIDIPEEVDMSGPKLTLENLEQLNEDRKDTNRVADANNATASDEDLVVKDAFLIFRAMCKLSVKSLDSELIDMRSHSVRSKLLSLHIIHTILKDHIDIFLSHDVVILSSNSTEQTRLINAVRQYICLSLSRNAASSLAPVFELSLEIFWIIISNLRSEFKREIPVFWDEIYFPVAEMKTSTPHQKRYLLSIFERLCNDSRCIIEFYLNYDCESRMPNICEKIIDYLTRLALVRVEVTQQQKNGYRDNKRAGISVYDLSKIANLTSSTMSSKPPEPEIYNHFPLEYALKMTSISCTVAFLKSLYSWAQKGIDKNRKMNATIVESDGSLKSPQRDRSATVDSSSSTANTSRNTSFVQQDYASESDDPEQFENLKQRKKELLEGIRQFNLKAKRGIRFFLDHGFIAQDDPTDIATFLLETDGLDKSVIGEYLGEGDEYNVAIMHAFVDEMEFDNTNFVDAMRKFLQSFRLPGESQKIDRFMLKFAERYVLGNPTVFSNADAAYVLAYSVIMLNTDLHSPQIKSRMTTEQFISNNSGIDNNKDLPSEFLVKIYDEILHNEIKLQSEHHAALLAGDISVTAASQAIGFFGTRDLNKEAYIHASKEMSTKTEQLVRNLGKRLKSEENNGSIFYVASHVHHVKSIFDNMWMSILACLTPPFKEYDDEDITKICLEGIKLAIRISCMFDLGYARTSFIGALIQFANLHNFEEMKPKNVEAIYIMLEVAVHEGNELRQSWSQILTSISQLERLQLIAQGVDKNSIPDVSVAKMVNRGSYDDASVSSSRFFSFTTQHTPSQNAINKFQNQHLSQETAALLTKTELEVSMDKVFTNSANLTGESIVDFVKALSYVLSEEIESSGDSSNPRMFCLQKVVDICYYNMSRIRLEWSQLWSIMGETFNKVVVRDNRSVVFFALDSLRQLSMRFFEIDELSHFKFQKEFLKPFEHAILHNDTLEVKEMVLECINNMILARSDKIKSGWKTIFGVLSAAAKESKESLVQKSFQMANWINKEYIDEVSSQESFADLVVCFTELAKNERFQKICLLSLDVLSKLVKQIANYNFGKQKNRKTSKATTSVQNDSLVKLWFPVLFGFHDIIMTGNELEVRSRALKHLFDTLLEYGEFFEPDFWDLICHQLLFPIFGVLNNHWQLGIDDDNDALSVWLSTTLIQALKGMVNLFTHYFVDLSRLLKDYLHLLTCCICQENDTIARIGRECLFTLLIENASKFNDEQWHFISKALEELFKLTAAEELFSSDPLKNRILKDDELSDMASRVDLNAPVSPSTTVINNYSDRAQKSKDKSSIVVKSVLQLLLIQTLSELFEEDNFYDAAPCNILKEMASYLHKSYEFAKIFNDDYDLRVRLWNAGVIERLPNLLKQESSSSAVFINIMFRMYCDDDKTDRKAKEEILDSIIPLCSTITQRFSSFDEANQHRNISTWKPVIVEIFQGFVELDDIDFTKHAPQMYNLTLRLFNKSMSQDLRLSIHSFLARVGEEFITPKSSSDQPAT